MEIGRFDSNRFLKSSRSSGSVAGPGIESRQSENDREQAAMSGSDALPRRIASLCSGAR